MPPALRIRRTAVINASQHRDILREQDDSGEPGGSLIDRFKILFLRDMWQGAPDTLLHGNSSLISGGRILLKEICLTA